jgi:uncharacterized membrane protein YphA (DoxX/SURF4 family)
MKILNRILRLIIGAIFIASAVAKIGNVQISRTSGVGNKAVSGADLKWSCAVPLGQSRALRLSYVPDLATFAHDVGNYHVPPRALANVVAITLPWIELLAGGLLVAGIWKRASACVITAMMVVFLAAIGWAVAHGYDIYCGCLGTLEGRRVGVTALAEDFLLLAMAAWLTRRPGNLMKPIAEANE